MSNLTLENVTYQDYSIQYPSATSSRIEEIDKEEERDCLLSMWAKRRQLKDSIFYRSLFPLLEIDLSSVQPHFEINNETSSMQEVTEKTFLEELMLEYNVVVRIPPKRRYTIQMKIENRRRGVPKIVEPEGLA
ncbi:hypothetical protein J7K28_02350 [Candidatus Aerophobetes bacterium]|nr:hypothetical protein [Candidatus Aerophobetes bacterium]